MYKHTYIITHNSFIHFVLVIRIMIQTGGAETNLRFRAQHIVYLCELLAP